MVMIKLFIFIIFNLAVFVSGKTTNCDRSSPGGVLTQVPYPFGFSSGCDIQLNRTTNGTILIGGYPVQQFNYDSLLVSVPAKCGRAVEEFQHLYGANYAPTSNNAVLLENCTEQVTCVIPETMLKTHLELIDCGQEQGNTGNVSCYSGNKNLPFLDYRNVTATGCRYLLSGVVSEMIGDGEAVSLDVQVVKLGWWLNGDCRCSENANCTRFISPTDGGAAYRCRCIDGFFGDGYSASSGCRKDSSGCNPSKYISGRCGGTARIGVLVGAIVLGASVIICLGLIYCFIRRRKISKSRSRVNRRFCEAKGITIPIHSYKEIEKATNGFSDKQRLGTGAYGTVYSGKLQNGEWVAVKRIKSRSDTSTIDQVMNEIKLLSSVSHPNLVRLLGCSVDKDEQVLVYEFMPNGTLCQHLQRERGHGLPWPVRLTIATETAQAIAYLHAMNPPIYHRDVKSSNILLDYDFKTKVADFGLSRLGIIESSHISTAPQGTPGYLDPEYHQNFHLSDKSDVYSFGVVLVEIITALRAVDFSRRQNEVNLASLAIDRIGRGCLEEIIDPFLEPNKDGWTVNTIHKVAEVAFRCLAFHSDMRPTMAEVATELEQIRSSKWASSEDKTTAVLSYEETDSSALSIISEKPTSMDVKKSEFGRRGLFGSAKSAEGKNFSPKSTQDPWPSDSSSPSSNSLLGYNSVM